MKTLFFKIIAIPICGILICYTSKCAAQKANPGLNRLFEKYYRESLKLDPVTETFLGDHKYDDQLANDISKPYLKMKYAFDRKYLRLLRPYSTKQLNTTDKIAYGYLKELLWDDLARSTYHFEYIPVNQFTSTPLTFGQLGEGNSAQPFNTPAQYLTWLKRVGKFIEWLDTAKANMRKGIATHIVLPKILVLKIIPQMEALGETDTSKSVFYNPLRHFPATFTVDDKTRLKAKFMEVIGGQLLPAYNDFAAFLKDEYLPHAQDAVGLYAIPGGAGMYKVYIRQYTTTDKSPEEIYQTGLREVKRITLEMDKLKDTLKFHGTLQDFLKYLRTDRQFMPFKTPEELLQAYRNIYHKIQPHLNDLFDISPKGRFLIRRVEAFREASQNGPSYMTGAKDGSRPGVFYVPVVDASKINVTFLGMEATFLHEAIPGHHYQISLQMENKNLPAFKRVLNFPVFTEGWALYVETLGKQLGCYGDPAQQMGALNNDMQRAMRLVIDVGIHTGKMTREEAIRYLLDHESISEEDAELSVERYMAIPGQALSYKIGQLEILRLKSKYEKELGTKFDIRKFHHALLSEGDMPLSVLDTYMADWAKNERTAHRQR